MRRPASQVQQVFEVDDAGVVELEKVVELTVGPLSVNEVLKGVDDLLDSHDPISTLVNATENHSVGTLAHFLLDLVVFVDLVVQLLRLFHSEIIINNQFFENTH